MVPAELLLEGVVGSTAYGLATPTSDVDYSGIYVEPTRNLLGLHPPSRERATKKGRDGADATYHEVGKAMALMLSCNPTAMEILWLADYLEATEFGLELVGLRNRFLSAKRVRDAYFGYGVAQLKRLTEQGRFQGSLETRREKHARHVKRLLWQGYELYTTGVLPIKVVDPEAYFEFGRTCAQDREARAAVALVTEYSQKFDDATTCLPTEPDEQPLEDLLQRVRAHFYRPEDRP